MSPSKNRSAKIIHVGNDKNQKQQSTKTGCNEPAVSQVAGKNPTINKNRVWTLRKSSRRKNQNQNKTEPEPNRTGTEPTKHIETERSDTQKHNRTEPKRNDTK